ncbi:MAG: glycosyltransferase [Vicinamibacterales bacterium]
MSSERRPRVLHVVDTFGATSETFVYRYVVGHRAFDAAVVCRTRANADRFPFERVTVVDDPLSRRASAHWISKTLLRVTGRSLWHRGVARAVTAWQPDVLHAHFGQVAVSVLPALATGGPPLVTSFYGYDAAVLGRDPRWRARYAELFTAASAVLAEGPAMRARLLALGAPEDRTFVQPVAVDVQALPTWTAPDRPTALFVGRFVEKKGLADALRAVARARVDVPDLVFRVIGDGPEREAATRLAADLHLADVVRFEGLRPYADVVGALSRASVLVHPSAVAADGDAEGGAPTILIEAQAIGTPIVTTRHDDIPFVTGGGGPGIWLCGEHDVPALAAAIVDAVRTRTASSSAHVRAHHDVRVEVDRLEALYRRVMAG